MEESVKKIIEEVDAENRKLEELISQKEVQSFFLWDLLKPE